VYVGGILLLGLISVGRRLRNLNDGEESVIADVASAVCVHWTPGREF
jgi:hypothetical protein